MAERRELRVTLEQVCEFYNRVKPQHEDGPGWTIGAVAQFAQERVESELADARDEIARLKTERDEEEARLGRQINSLRDECRCPACSCCTPEDADASECGCDHPVCKREGSLADAFTKLHAERRTLVELAVRRWSLGTASGRVLEPFIDAVLAECDRGGRT